MEKEDIKFIFSLVSAIGVVGGILSWWVSKLLKERVDSKEHSIEIRFLKESLNKFENRFNDEITHLRNELRALINKI